MVDTQSFRVLSGTSIFFLYLAVLIARTRESIGRFPGDPGYSYLLDGVNHGIRSLSFGDPYLHVVARFTASIAVMFPLGWQAVAASMLVHLIWALSALAVSTTVKLETHSSILAVLAGLLLVTAPHAAESSLGNIGNVKWPITSALIVMCCSPQMLTKHPVRVGIGIALVGLTQPLAILGAIPIATNVLRENRSKKWGGFLLATLLATTAAQLGKVGLGDAASGRSTKVTTPWDGMGLFWWSGLAGPILIAGAILVLLSVPTIRMRQTNLFVPLLAVLSIAFSFGSYSLGGIADRYFVLPMTLSLVAALVIFGLPTPQRRRRFLVGFVSASLMLLVPTVRWFSTSAYLTSGPTWSSEIQRSREACVGTLSKSVEIELSSGGSTVLSCAQLTDE